MNPVQASPLSELRTRTSVKWQAYAPEVLPLFIAEMDYPLAEPIRTALIDAVGRSDLGYVAEPGPVAPAFSGFAAERWGWQIAPQCIRTATDVSVGIVEVLRQTLPTGSGVVICPPVYQPFFQLLPEAGHAVVEVPISDRDGASALDLDGLESAFAAGARGFLLCSPQNPLGLVHSRETLEAVAILAARYGVVVVSDEIHAPLVHDARTFTPYLDVSDEARGSGVAITSASKGWNIAGAKCALMIAQSPRMLAALDALPDELSTRTGLLGLIGNTAAFTSGTDWLDSAIDAIRDSSALLSRLLDEHLPGVTFRPPAASYLAWLDFRGAAGWGDDPSARALRTGVALSRGDEFGSQGRGFARLNLACSPDVLTEAVRRLAAAE